MYRMKDALVTVGVLLIAAALIRSCGERPEATAAWTVPPGGTLWAAAGEYAGRYDRRDWIYEAQRRGVPTRLQPGQVWLVPDWRATKGDK